jgi:hypothetical protein
VYTRSQRVRHPKISDQQHSPSTPNFAYPLTVQRNVQQPCARTHLAAAATDLGTITTPQFSNEIARGCSHEN